MDIAALSTMMSQVNIMQQVNISVMKMSLDSGKQQMNNIIQMDDQTNNIEKSINPHLGNTIDVKL